MEIETEIEMAMTIIRNRKIERKKKGKEERRKVSNIGQLGFKMGSVFSCELLSEKCCGKWGPSALRNNFPLAIHIEKQPLSVGNVAPEIVQNPPTITPDIRPYSSLAPGYKAFDPTFDPG